MADRSGVFAMDRGWFDHPSFADEQFTEREAWAWLISDAAWKARTRRVGKIVVSLSRGQLANSLRFMADKWQWNEPRVRRFLKRLKSDAMIDAATDAGITVITITNYNIYQRVSLPSDAETLGASDAAATQQRRKTEDIKNIKQIDDDRGEAVCLIAPEAFKIAEEAAEVCGFKTPHEWPPGWCGAPYTADKWLRAGWQAPIILVAIREAMARKRDGPPESIVYFEKPIAKAMARQSAPLPKVRIIEGKTETVHVQNGQQRSREDFRNAVDRLAEFGRSGGAPICGDDGGEALQILPPARRA